MTTIAFDGKWMAADSLVLDAFDMKSYTSDKLWSNAFIIIGGAGPSGKILKWYKTLSPKVTATKLLEDGYSHFETDKNDPHLLMADRITGKVYRHLEGMFIPTPYGYFAIGSGRDYALAAMSLGFNAEIAVATAMKFDNNTGGDIKLISCDNSSTYYADNT